MFPPLLLQMPAFKYKLYLSQPWFSSFISLHGALISWATPARTQELTGFPLQLSIEVGIEVLLAPPPSENRKGFALAINCKGTKSSASMLLHPCALHLHTCPWLWQLPGTEPQCISKTPQPQKTLMALEVLGHLTRQCW